MWKLLPNFSEPEEPVLFLSQVHELAESPEEEKLLLFETFSS